MPTATDLEFKIFGDRVLLRDIGGKEEVGGIAIPETSSRAYLMMEVVEVGDGRLRGVDGVIVRRMSVTPGDHVLVQVNPMMFGNNAQRINGEKYLALNHHDIIARVDSGVFNLSLSTFHPIGRWVLVRIAVPDRVGAIWLPNAKRPLDSAGEVKTYFAKAGDVATEELGDLPIGTRLMLEHARVSPLNLQRIPCAYVDVTAVAGAIPGEVSLDHLEDIFSEADAKP